MIYDDLGGGGGGGGVILQITAKSIVLQKYGLRVH